MIVTVSSVFGGPVDRLKCDKVIMTAEGQPRKRKYYKMVVNNLTVLHIPMRYIKRVEIEEG